MQEIQEISVYSCPVHLIPAAKFCQECSKPICSKCKDKDGHKIVELKELLSNPEWIVPKELIPQYKEEASLRKFNLLDEAAERRDDVEELEISIKDIINKIERKESLNLHENDLIKKAIEGIRDIQMDAETETLRNACEEAVRSLDVSDAVSKEQLGYEDLIKRMKERQERLRIMYNKAKINLLRIEIVGMITNIDKITDEEHLALMMLREEGVITGQSYCVGCNQENFRAFGGVQRLDEIQEVLKSELIDIGCGVKVSNPVVYNKFKRLNGNLGSISHNGVAAIYTRGGIGLTEGFNGEIEFVDLLKGKSVRIQVENETTVGFYDKMMIFVTKGMPLREVKAKYVLKHPQQMKLISTGTIPCNSAFLDVSVLQSSRVLYYTIAHCRACLYNVDTKENKKIFKYGDIVFFATITGLNCLGKGGFLDYHYIGGSKYRTYAYVFNKHMSKQKVGKCNQQESYCTIIPSYSKPSRPKNALLWFGESGFYINKTKVSFDTVIHLSNRFPIIRMYKDIFLGFDKILRKYVLFRIIVP